MKIKEMNTKLENRAEIGDGRREADSPEGNIRELTRAELQVMRLLWDRKQAFVSDLVAAMEEPRPAYNTVSTIVRILEKKGFVSHRSFGKSYQYYPLVSKEEYTSGFMSSVLNNFFGNSVAKMVSFFSEREEISVREMDEILKILGGREKDSASGNK